jgi:hypothetical protein
MKNNIRYLLALIGTNLLMFMFVNAGEAQSALTQIPLDINLSVTKSSELETKGICIARVNSPDSAKTRCIRYNMDNNKFYAHTSFAGNIDRISFQSVAHHQIPESWKKIGIRLASSYRYQKAKQAAFNNAKAGEPEYGNTLSEFMAIIISQNAKEITTRVSYKSDYQIGETVAFVIDNYYYMAEFMKWVKPEWCKECPTYSDYNNGLVSIEVSRPF